MLGSTLVRVRVLVRIREWAGWTGQSGGYRGVYDTGKGKGCSQDEGMSGAEATGECTTRGRVGVCVRVHFG